MPPGRLPQFGPLLRQLRRTSGLTQEELADRARVGVRTLRDLETGRTARPQRSTVELLANALELDAAERKDFVVASRGWPGAGRVPRQRTQQAVQTSWRLLTEAEQDSLCWLAALPGRWTVAMAAALLHGRAAPADTQPLGAFVEHLVGLGLVSTVPTPGPARYWLRDAVRLFVSEHGGPALAVARERHATLVARPPDRDRAE